MALSVCEVLDRHGHVDRDALARAFAARHSADPLRGYGAGARRILRDLAAGVPWPQAAQAAHDGQGSKGNGAAMRAAPIGAWFADDLGRAAAEAAASADPTHAHADGRAGAVAVAVAAALAVRVQQGGLARDGAAWLRVVLDHTPDGELRLGVGKALALDPGFDVATAAHVLGNGVRLLASDTVPLALWCAARHLADYEAALWTTVAALGDRDTTCAIVGGIVACAAGRQSIPAAWRAAREPVGGDFEPHR